MKRKEKPTRGQLALALANDPPIQPRPIPPLRDPRAALRRREPHRHGTSGLRRDVDDADIPVSGL